MPQVTPTPTPFEAPRLTLLDPVSGQPRELLTPGRPTLITFLRGTWCEACRTFLDRVTPLHGPLEARGVALVGVVCQGRHWVQSWLALNPLPFPLLVDEHRDAARAYGVYKALGLDGIHIARPASFLVDRSGHVVWSHIGGDKQDRPDNDQLLATLARLT
ncbi:redoxin domain-containing protein [Corallococcus sp. ZKHCc1 1396]|uniref:Redoxin domain-containing protein n=1 Tax=Corallococcus soli TaxID=2710757 RepID=A0ABR9PH19_9BACT|nr:MULTISPECIES: peroxiredoxin family protein [Corallococcus]MBE4747208.1 redoxin domain-containing protein [Corallococcus soli]MCY1036521.1 peroxiredoxin family protein [Corallococcus sp. BB11-1]